MTIMHVYLSEEVQHQLKPFAKNRKLSKSAVVRIALEKLFEQEEIDPTKYAALKTVLNRYFTVPSFHTVKSFWGTLIMLGSRNPNDSSKTFWGEMAYLSPKNMTHREILNQVKEQVSLQLLEYKNASRIPEPNGADKTGK